MVVFSTLPQRFRNEASTIFAMIRNIGAGAGISVILAWMIRDNAAIQSRLVETVTPDNPLVIWRMPQFDPLDPVSATGMVGQIMRQVAMLGYVDAFRLLFVLAVIMTPLCLIMRSAKQSAEPRSAMHAE